MHDLNFWDCNSECQKVFTKNRTFSNSNVQVYKTISKQGSCRRNETIWYGKRIWNDQKCLSGKYRGSTIIVKIFMLEILILYFRMVYQVLMEKTKKIKIMDVARFHDESYKWLMYLWLIILPNMFQPHEGANEEFLLLQNTIEPHNYLIYDNCNRDRAVNKEKT